MRRDRRHRRIATARTPGTPSRRANRELTRKAGVYPQRIRPKPDDAGRHHRHILALEPVEDATA